jgi:hypothetical protein
MSDGIEVANKVKPRCDCGHTISQHTLAHRACGRTKCPCQGYGIKPDPDCFTATTRRPQQSAEHGQEESREDREA